jgi:putative ATP-grasp target RiPP
MSLVLQYAIPAPPDPVYKEPVRYDKEKQLLVYVKDGTPVCKDRETIKAMGTTTSTAGSKTHFDD